MTDNKQLRQDRRPGGKHKVSSVTIDEYRTGPAKTGSLISDFERAAVNTCSYLYRKITIRGICLQH